MPEPILPARPDARSAHLHEAKPEPRRGEERYRALVEATSELVWNAPPSGEFLTEQPGWSAFTGQSFEELKGWGWLAAVHPEDQPRTRERWSTAVAHHALYEVEHRLRRHDGEYRHMQVRAVPLKNEDGSLREWMGLHRDITDRVEVEQALRQSVERERQARAELERALALVDSLVASTPVSFALLDTEMRYLKVNPALTRVNGLPPEAHLGRSVRELLGKAADGLEPLLRRVLETGEALVNLEGAVKSPDQPGGHRHFLSSYFPVRGPDAAVTGVGATLIEVTDQVRARRHLTFLAEAGHRLFASLDEQETLDQVARLMVEAVADGCMVDLLDDAGGIARVAVAHKEPRKAELIHEIRRRYGLSATEPLRKEALRTGRALVFPEMPYEALERSALDAEHLRLLRELEGRAFCVLPLRVRDHALGTFTVSLSQPGRTFSAEEVALMEDLASRAAVAIDHSRLYTDLQKAVRVRDEFLSVASHELKTPLTPLSLKLQLLAREVKQQPDTPFARGVQDYIDTGRKQIRKLTELIGDLLDVSRIGGGRLQLHREPVDLEALVREVVSRFEPAAAQAGSSLEVRAEGPCRGEWDAARLEQVLTNLLDNALKYGFGRPVSLHLRAGPEHAVLTVTDHGIGIEPAHLSRIFERFERAVSERHYGGLGLGLYITRELVQAHGGSIQVESEPGVRTVFTVELPLK